MGVPQAEGQFEPSYEVATTEMEANTALTTVEVAYPSINEKAWEFCSKLSRSSLVPSAIRSTDTADHTAELYMLMDMGRSLGLSFTQTLTGMFILPGATRPSLYTNTKRAIVMQHGGIFIEERWDEQQQCAICTIKRGANTITRKFGVEQAMSMGKVYRDPNDGTIKGCLVGGKAGPWAQDYKNMCLMRAVSRCCDAAYPDALLGLPSVEEATDELQAQQAPIQKTEVKTTTADINPDIASAIKPKKAKKNTVTAEVKEAVIAENNQEFAY